MDTLVFSPDLGFVTAMTAALEYVEVSLIGLAVACLKVEGVVLIRQGTAQMGYCENGAPFGILFITKPGEEKKLLSIL